MTNSTVLLIDDDDELLQSLARALKPLVAPLKVCEAVNAGAALQLLRSERPQVVVLDLCLDDRVGVDSGFALLEAILRGSPMTRVVILTGHGSISHGVRALMSGAASFVEKPADPTHLAVLVKDAAQQAEIRQEYDRLQRRNSDELDTQLVGDSLPMQRLRDRVSFAASTNQPVLIVGETGTGKGLCARIIHEKSTRSVGRFVHYQPNFGGGDLVQSELFGHLRGAFTGASAARRGLALEADRGTLFIDELDEVPFETQVKLLDLIQERRVRALGSDSYQSVDCRFIAATNRTLSEALETGRIRRDLYHRIAHLLIELPALRTRISDLPLLCQHILGDLCVREALNVFELTREALEHLQQQQWPGNVRELEAVVTNAAYQARHRGRTVIERDDILPGSLAPAMPAGVDAGAGSFHKAVMIFKAKLVQEALARVGGNQVKAAAELGLDRKTLRRLMK